MTYEFHRPGCTIELPDGTVLEHGDPIDTDDESLIESGYLRPIATDDEEE